jgi:hypothetical protein
MYNASSRDKSGGFARPHEGTRPIWIKQSRQSRRWTSVVERFDFRPLLVASTDVVQFWNRRWKNVPIREWSWGGHRGRRSRVELLDGRRAKSQRERWSPSSKPIGA